MRIRALLVAALVAGAMWAGAGPAQALGPQVCSLTGIYQSGGAGRDGFTYGLDGAGRCRNPSAPITITTVYGGGQRFSPLPSCRPQPEPYLPDVGLPNDGEALGIEMAIGSAPTVFTQWRLRGVTQYVTGTVLVYDIAPFPAGPGRTGRAVVTSALGQDPLCVRGGPIEIRLELDG